MFAIDFAGMNPKREEEIARLRCENKSVKFISKKLSINRVDIERTIAQWIIDTDKFIEESVSGHKLQKVPDPKSVFEAIISNPNVIPLQGKILDYVALHRSNHHDRIMDCIRFHVLRSIKGTK